jgi:hypothetical protein
MMLIKSIALWNEGGDLREIELGPGLNIITGESQTGKSTLIDIINYCLGAKTIRIPAGPIASTVHYYGMLASVGGTNAFFGRPGVGEGAKSNSEAQLELGAADLPAFDELGANTNTGALRDWIGRMVGIEENKFEPPATASRRPLAASLPHALIHCFQRQDEIASKANLFHRQSEDFLPAAIRDTLPYFLGATGPEQLRLAAKLRDLKRELAKLERSLGDLEDLREDGMTEAQGLLTQAADAGLVSLDAQPQALADALTRLGEVQSAPVPAAPLQPEGEEFDRLQGERSELAQELRGLREQRSLTEAISSSGEGARDEGIEQVVRLQQIGILAEAPDGDHCPVCEQELSEPVPAVEEMRRSLTALEQHIGSVERDRPALVEVTGEIERSEQAVRERIEANRSALDELAAAADAIEAHQGRLDRGAWVRGRIDHFLEKARATESTEGEAIRAAHKRLRKQISDLEEELDPAHVRESATSILVRLGRPMTEFAQGLGLEHAESGVRIDLGRLTVVADTPTGPVYMDTSIGSAKNWVGYHLAATLSLQTHFISEDRPVPSFLVLDQPSQAFFPSDLPSEEITDQDRDDAKAQFTLIRDVVADLDEQLQVIVLDHADFDVDWYQEAVRERWRDGDALIPQSWIEKAATSEVAEDDSEGTRDEE